MTRRTCTTLFLFILATVSVVAPSASGRVRKPKKIKDVPVVRETEANAPAPMIPSRKQVGGEQGETAVTAARGPRRSGPPLELIMTKAHGKRFDVRTLPHTPPVRRERPEREAPFVTPGVAQPDTIAQNVSIMQLPPPMVHAPAPAPTTTFAGLDFNTWGAGHPPDTNGDVGPNHYIQTINTSIGIYNKSGTQLAAFTFDTFMSQGNFGNLCDTNNFGDPVVLYDSFEDRWIITDFAFQLDGSGNVVNPPGSFECIAVSMNGDPVSGGWNYYSINTTGGLGDYPKLGVWPDGLYMSVNMFDYSAFGSFQDVRLYAFNKADMYAGSPTVRVVSFDLPADQFTVLPANARLQTGTPPAGSPNYFASVWKFLNKIEVWQFQVDWDRIALSSVTGPIDTTMGFWWEQYNSSTVPTPANRVDTLYPRLMVQNQYSNIGGVESLWQSHTVGAGNPTSNLTSAQAAVRYYQTTISSGVVNANTTQSFTYSPDATLFRFMPSLGVDHAGDMAIGYSTASAAANPAIVYAGRLAGDAPNSITQTEQTMIAGTGSQSGTCGNTCTRWGDYSAMTLDPDGCRFWYTNMYYAVTGLNYQTAVGTFQYPSCAPLTTGSISGVVRRSSDNSPINGATVQLGVRTATTDSGGNYTFAALPQGTYPEIIASSPGFIASTPATVVVPGGGSATSNFLLVAAPLTGCPTDTTQSDFQTGAALGVDVNTVPGSVTLPDVTLIDQQNGLVTNRGFGFTSTSWAGQTFVAASTGAITKVDVNLFCSGCSGTPPNITVAIRMASGGVPIGGDLATATIPGFTSGAGGPMTATFATPVPVTSGLAYAVIFRVNSLFSPGLYAFVCSCTTSGGTNPYANGSFVTSGDSGSTWTADATAGGRDIGFDIFVHVGYTTGEYISATKDADNGVGSTAAWSTLTWNATTPVGTSVLLQVAGSNAINGPYNFVGPDGSASTFFASSPIPLATFNGLRFLKYRAVLTSTNPTLTPSLDDVTACFASLPPGTPAPPVVTAAAGTSVPAVSVTWLPSAGATSYKIYRRGAGGGYVLAGTSVLTTFPDTGAIAPLAANNAYLYVVHALIGATESPDSFPVLATTVDFPETITQNVTTIKATQIDQLRTAITAVAALASTGITITDNPLPGVAVKAQHISELRTALNTALTTLGLPPVVFTDPALTTGTTRLRRSHVQELRDAVK